MEGIGGSNKERAPPKTVGCDDRQYTKMVAKNANAKLGEVNDAAPTAERKLPAEMPLPDRPESIYLTLINQNPFRYSQFEV